MGYRVIGPLIDEHFIHAFAVIARSNEMAADFRGFAHVAQKRVQRSHIFPEVVQRKLDRAYIKSILSNRIVLRHSAPHDGWIRAFYGSEYRVSNRLVQARARAAAAVPALKRFGLARSDRLSAIGPNKRHIR